MMLIAILLLGAVILLAAVAKIWAAPPPTDRDEDRPQETVPANPPLTLVKDHERG